jgi:glycosyltransferase involved in cell wall biosynthesis
MDGGILINERMQRFFRKNQKTVVLNSFADLSYAEDLTLEEPVRLLYSGSLDDIRGADLIEDLSAALTEAGLDFDVFITGKGPLQSHIEKVSQQEARLHYEGFVSEQRLDELLSLCDVGLVLQKPDHPFSKGSFPSKIDLYAQYNLAILTLELIED